MAGLSQDAKSGIFRVHFRYGNKQFQKSLKTKDRKKAESRKGRIEETLLDLERGRLDLPPGADFWQFVWTDGKRDQKPKLETLTLEGLFGWYFESLPPGAKATKTGKVEAIHANHFKRLLGARRALDSITGQDLQASYINARAREDLGNPRCPC